MIIVEGFAYADDMKPVFAVVEARPLKGRRLFVRFNDGTCGIADIGPLVEKRMYAPLRDDAVFRNISLPLRAPTWTNGEVDIAPEWLKDHCVEGNLTDEEKWLIAKGRK
jgi:hypothetical protein